MTVFLNGKSLTTHAPTLADLLAEHLDDDQVATALNGEFVALHQRATTLLSDGDRIEVLAPMQGG